MKIKFDKLKMPKIDLPKVDNKLATKLLMLVIWSLTALFAFKGAVLLYTIISVPSTVEAAVNKSKPNAQDVALRIAVVKKQADQLKAKNLFSPQPPPTPPQVIGILGDKVLIGGKWCGVGENVSNTLIKKISATDVSVEWMGKEMKLSPLATSASTQMNNSMPPNMQRRPGIK